MDYLAVGHVTEDVWPDGKTPGGPVMYASRTALAWLDHVAVLTAAADTFDSAAAFPGVDVRLIPAPSTTQFRNIYTAGGRRQIVRPCPVRITAAHLTDDLLSSRIIHLAPVCNEVDADIVARIPAGVFVGVTPQGWLRRWDEQGVVRAAGWEAAGAILPRASATVFSIDDVAGDWNIARAWAAQTSILVVTQAAEGCTLFVDGSPIHVPAPRVAQVDPTGAGDIFAAALFITLRQGCEPARACAIANCIAAGSVAFPHGQGFPTRQDARRCAGAVV